MSKTATKRAAKSASKRSIAVALFIAALPTLPQVGQRAFRKSLMADIEKQTGGGGGATMYNHAKKQAVKQGLVSDFGRAAKVAAPAVPVGRWQIVDKASGKVVDAKASRAQATAAKGDGQVVRDSEK